MNRAIKTPGPDHPIDLQDAATPMRAACGERAIALSAHAMVMSEKGQDDVVYFPRESVDFSVLERSATSTWCPYKGEASYFSLRATDGAPAVQDVAWSYEDPLPAMTRIRGHLAFYRSKETVGEA